MDLSILKLMVFVSDLGVHDDNIYRWNGSGSNCFVIYGELLGTSSISQSVENHLFSEIKCRNRVGNIKKTLSKTIPICGVRTRHLQ